ncbi:hypothetical protein BDZ90DRAFT_68863 [Jaminaea rosea]|uniref:Protein-S-isoprenylcysteine O-methyltransferase n=1 Tax=Jaminaea rosea TaxID=1569628 RepID=A0A316UR31_9BASI|nr:hypothetical protein BDZ90DRAFT_68863 [Jaminaea rosea]PWN25585.1 hypothetical protein BDZ90DRAFT_68863 [Jaminaea rosea]
MSTATTFLPDVALLILSTYYIVRAIDPPFAASAEDRAGAMKDSSGSGGAGGDLVSSLGLTSIHRPVQLAFVLAGAWCSKVLLSGQGWDDVPGDVTLWRALFAVGNVLTTIGGIGRLACYRELGKWFTFDLAVQRGQKVVDTGPYAYARHPSYTALIVGFYGTALSFLAANPSYSLRSWGTMNMLAGLAFHQVACTVSRADNARKFITFADAALDLAASAQSPHR